jgi:hypothetical protein
VTSTEGMALGWDLFISKVKGLCATFDLLRGSTIFGCNR